MTTGGRQSGRRASLAVGKDGMPEDSRALLERHAKLRMEHTDHEQQLKDEEAGPLSAPQSIQDRRNQHTVAEVLAPCRVMRFIESKAKAWGVGGKRISGMVNKAEKRLGLGFFYNLRLRGDKKDLHGRLGGGQAQKDAREEKKAQLETMTLDKKRQIDTAAAVLGCPAEPGMGRRAIASAPRT